jgi:hypothetical protein
MSRATLGGAGRPKLWPNFFYAILIDAKQNLKD